MYLNRNNILSYNASLNFVVLKRGFGKTWTFKELAISEFLKSGLKTLWLRRYKLELRETKSKFLGDIVNHFGDHKLIMKGNTLFVDGKPAIEFMCLTQAQDVKSSTYADFKYLIFDEFIIEGKAKYYIGEECTVFSSLMSTFLRDSKNRKIFMLGNKVTTVTPYTLYFNLPDFDGVRYLANRSILLYCKDNDGEIEDNYKDAPLEKILQGTPYYNYALANNSLDDNNDFVEKRPNDLKVIVVIDVNGTKVGMFYDTPNSKIYFDLHCDKTIKAKYTLDNNDLSKSYMLLNKNTPMFKMLKDFYYNGRVYFNDIRTKIIMKDLLKFII